MKKIEKYKLIEGQFSPSDSINILFALFNSKINFHQLESFRIQETNHNSRLSSQHEQRAIELKEAYLLMKSIVKLASDNNMDLEIHGNIDIVPVKRKTKI
jgi:hypothetical protein